MIRKAMKQRFDTVQSMINSAAEAVEKKYNPNQPRVPVGQSGGGRWASSSSASPVIGDPRRIRILEDTWVWEYEDAGGKTVRGELIPSNNGAQHQMRRPDGGIDVIQGKLIQGSARQ